MEEQIICNVFFSYDFGIVNCKRSAQEIPIRDIFFEILSPYINAIPPRKAVKDPGPVHSTRFSILELLIELKKNLNFSMIFISHNLSLVKLMCDKIIVLRSDNFGDS